jgi:hypothetical protein
MKSQIQVSLKTACRCVSRQPVDGAGWRRHRTDHEGRDAAGEPRCSVLRQRCASREYSGLDHAATDFVPVPQAVEGQEMKMLEKKLKQWSKCHSRRGLPLRKRFGVEWRLRQQADAPHCEQGVTLACDQYFNAWY